jgi:hypothetical protein
MCASPALMVRPHKVQPPTDSTAWQGSGLATVRQIEQKPRSLPAAGVFFGFVAFVEPVRKKLHCESGDQAARR